MAARSASRAGVLDHLRAHPPPGRLDRGLPVAADRRRRPRARRHPDQPDLLRRHHRRRRVPLGDQGRRHPRRRRRRRDDGPAARPGAAGCSRPSSWSGCCSRPASPGTLWRGAGTADRGRRSTGRPGRSGAGRPGRRHPDRCRERRAAGRPDIETRRPLAVPCHHPGHPRPARPRRPGRGHRPRHRPRDRLGRRTGKAQAPRPGHVDDGRRQDRHRAARAALHQPRPASEKDALDALLAALR